MSEVCMALEIELKFLNPDFAALRRRLMALGAEPLDRVFERNLVFDDAARSLKSASTLLRLRTERKSLLTLKRPPEREQDGVKVFEEIETEVADPLAMQRMLEALGYREAFAYEKLRETWRFGEQLVCLDILPFGRFVEIEGEREALFEAARALGLPPESSSTKTYHQLNLERQTREGANPSETFVFEPAERARIETQEFGRPWPPSTAPENDTILQKTMRNH
jgi:adenylate cyclase class 2